MHIQMKYQIKLSPQEYAKKYPRKASVIKRAVKRGVKQYEETFKRLASV